MGDLSITNWPQGFPEKEFHGRNPAKEAQYLHSPTLTKSQQKNESWRHGSAQPTPPSCSMPTGPTVFPGGHTHGWSSLELWAFTQGDVHLLNKKGNCSFCKTWLYLSTLHQKTGTAHELLCGFPAVILQPQDVGDVCNATSSDLYFCYKIINKV